MDDTNAPTSYPGLLAGHLAKLHHRLRHLHVDGDLTGPMAAAGPAYSVASRLRVSAAMLADPAVCHTAAQAPLQRLGVVLGEFVSGLGNPPARLPAYLLPALEYLADFLQHLFQEFDSGLEMTEACTDPKWQLVISAIIWAGTPLQTGDDIEMLLGTWHDQYGQGTLSATTSQQLRDRWLRLRDYGDQLWGTDTDNKADIVGHAVLLLDSPFRRDQLIERLQRGGWTVETAVDCARVLNRLAAPRPPDIVICDNLEPSQHLAEVCRELASSAIPGRRPSLVLVASAAANASSQRERALNLGAHCAWSEPFRLTDLQAGLALDSE